MGNSRWKKVEEIFQHAAELQPSEQRAYIVQACGEDAAIMREVESLLGHDAGVDALLGSRPKDISARHQLQTGAVPPEQIGPYKILETLGEGGMGTVYLAEQTSPVHRRVALKIIKLGMDTKQVVARFEVEREALALMNHPGVAKVFDAGVSDQGRPYFVMEHVQGIAITDYCDQNRLSTNERLDLFMQVCHAVQHAHQKGIIHRDIKPSNILVAVSDGAAVPKVIDFGVAKATQQRLTENTLFTEQGQIIGTPGYMSPEQTEMSALDIDTRTDIYSLGVLLYELLVGARPFDDGSLREAGLAEILRIIREVEPPKPSTRFSSLGENSTKVAHLRRTEINKLSRVLRGDLDWVIMKALEKDRTRRYDSASDFAADIQRHLRDEPVLAGPPTARYRMGKFVRRNRVGVFAASALLVVLLAGITGTSWGLLTATAARDAEREAKEQTQAALTLAQTRADELKTVTEFQQSMLSDIDVEAMGRGIFSVVTDGVRETMEANDASPDDINQALSALAKSLKGVNATNVALSVVDEHVLAIAVKAMDRDFADQPLVQAALKQTVADTYKDIGLYQSAMPLQQKALKTRRRVLGHDHPDTLTSISNMGVLLQSMGKLDEALPYYKESLDGYRRVLGNDHSDTLTSIDNMGELLWSMGKLDEALPYQREALDGRKSVLGNDHPDTLTSISNMGVLLQSMGKLDEALPYYKESLDGYRRVLGNDHSDTLSSINAMGFLLESMGKLDEAMPYYREALDGKRRVLGDDHPDTLTSINNMGALLNSMGKLDEVMPYFRETLDGRRRVLGDDHPDTLTTIGNMGYLLYSMGKLDEAMPYFRETLDGMRRSLGDDHPDTLTLINNMGGLLNALNKHEDAIEVLRAGKSAARRTWTGPNTRWLGNYLVKLGEAESATGRFAKGEATLLEAHKLLAEGFGEDHVRTTKCIAQLITLYESWHTAEPGKGYNDKAAEWRAKLPEENEPKKP